MTYEQAIATGLAGGYLLRFELSGGAATYLADYRRKGNLTTPFPAEAEWFRHHRDALEVAERASFYTTFKCAPTPAPGDVRPQTVAAFGTLQRIGPDPGGEAQIALSFPEIDCPNCGERHTARVASGLRCFACGNAWTPERYSIVESIDELAKFYKSDPPALCGCSDDLLDRIADEMDGELEPGITDEESRMCFRAACSAIFGDEIVEALDDDDADVTAASLSHPGERPRVVAPEVP